MRNAWIAALILVSTTALGQGLGDKIYVGGGLGFNTNSSWTTLSISPMVGYKLTQRLSVGIGVSYQYTAYKTVDLQLDHWGGSLFSRFALTRSLFLAAEYEYLTVEYPINPDYSQTARQGYSSLFGGAGFSQPLGGAASFYITGLYNFLYADGTNSPYGNPWMLRAGVAVGF